MSTARISGPDFIGLDVAGMSQHGSPWSVSRGSEPQPELALYQPLPLAPRAITEPTRHTGICRSYSTAFLAVYLAAWGHALVGRPAALGAHVGVVRVGSCGNGWARR